MAEAVNNLDKGAQRAAERQLNWCRNTITKDVVQARHFVATFSQLKSFSL